MSASKISLKYLILGLPNGALIVHPQPEVLAALIQLCCAPLTQELTGSDAGTPPT
jgi:hypothetical protein